MQKLKWALAAIASAIGLLAAGAAEASLAHGTLVFTDKTGVVGPTDNIPVYVTLTLDAGSDPFKASMFMPPISGGIPDALLAANGFDVSAPHSSYLTIGYACGATLFNPLCFDGAPYTFNYAPLDLDVAPGGTQTFLFGTLIHSVASVPVGTTLRYLEASLLVHADGQPLGGGFPISLSVPIALTCPSGDCGDGFTRTVVGPSGGGVDGVPEPAAWTLMILGFGFVGASLRRGGLRA